MKTMLELMALITLFIIDRYSKLLALHAIPACISVLPGMWIDLSLNRGFAFSLGEDLIGGNPVIAVIGMCVALVCISMLLGDYWGHSHLFVAIGLIANGALSNMLDRLLYGGVVDFIVLGYGQWFFPTFNFADIYICAGFAMYVYYYVMDSL